MIGHRSRRLPPAGDMPRSPFRGYEKMAKTMKPAAIETGRRSRLRLTARDRADADPSARTGRRAGENYRERRLSHRSSRRQWPLAGKAGLALHPRARRRRYCRASWRKSNGFEEEIRLALHGYMMRAAGARIASAVARRPARRRAIAGAL